ncbi:MAG: hypothetical protein QNK37_12425 [Acidobacteriota bacterium]|nr:hypothetical protein [Acidobacteriota bacterium]
MKLMSQLVFLILFCQLNIAQDKDLSVSESIKVRRTLIEVRVLKAGGQPVLGLEAEDFHLTWRGNPVTLVSTRWVDEEVGREDVDSGEFFDIDEEIDEEADDRFWDEEPEQKIHGRVIVFFLQKDSTGEIGGDLARLIRPAQAVIDELSPTDYVAVLSFDSSFKLNLDLTQDHFRVPDALFEGLTTAEGKPFGKGFFPSIGKEIDRYKADRVNDCEAALLILGDALAELPGSKSMIFMGYGLGSMSGTGISYPNHFGMAMQTIHKSRTTVFVMDAHAADYHTLEGSLKDLAFNTGGQYFKTYGVPMNMFNRVIKTIAGYYELVFEAPEDAPPYAPYRISIAKPHYEVLVREPYRKVRHTKKRKKR